MYKKIIDIIFDFLRGRVLAWLRKWVLEWLILKIFGRALGGIWGFLAGFFFDIAWKKWFVPAYYWAMRKSKTAIKRVFYKKKAKDLKEAKNEKDLDDAIDHIP